MHDARSQIIIKQRNGLAAMLIILIGLNRNRRQRCIRGDILRFAQKAMAGVKAAMKQLVQRNLQTRRRSHRVEIHVMNMDITIFMSGSHLGIQTIRSRIRFGQRAAVLQHHPHRAVTVNVGIFTFFINFLGILNPEVFQSLH